MTKEYIAFKCKELGVPFAYGVVKRRDYINLVLPRIENKIKHLVNVCIQEEDRNGKILVSEVAEENIKKYRSLYRENDRLSKLNLTKNYSSQFKPIEELLSVPIVSLLGEPIKRGRDWLYYSPLRDDGKHPSFTVNPEKNLWFDFVIGEGGSVIDLVMQMNGWNIKETLKYLEELV